MSTFWNVLIVILLVLVIALALLYYFGQKAQKKQAAQQEQLEATRQVVSMLIIDKKRLKLKESGLPKIQTLISETTIFDSIPVKKEIKAVVSGIYITEIKSVRGGRVEAPQQKKSLRVRLSEKLLRKSKELNASAAEDSKGKKKKK